ncbi:PREDICTED: F-box protein ETP1-like [Camelina sativa]|uniref:F-box protein ETP1-like n=1 Tax=Camelina sativa TaxID=90675 RepID=A0ABM0W4G4_CAMSA|nr:PREDICTED: F-box protein ETP1-like [Camelina sativa]
MTILDLLNDDLVEEILCRVPATSLKRLRATCKRWNRLFKDDRRFASEHCDKAPKEFLSLFSTAKFRICPLSINVPPPSVEVKRELSLPGPYFNNLLQFDIAEVFHCDGLLLCSTDCDPKIVVWNPFTGQTRWIEVGIDRWFTLKKLVLGYYYQDKNNKNKACSKRKSYKILCVDYAHDGDHGIYELNSCDSWRRIPDGDLIPPGWSTDCSRHAVFLKGSAYFLANEKSKPHLLGLSLLRFDFSTEKSSLFVPLPYQCPEYEVLSLSVVREEKLSLFLQPDDASKAEIWVTSKIDETTKVKAVSWSKVFAFDLSPDLQITSWVSFLLDEDKKVAVCCESWVRDDKKAIDNIYFLGEDNKVSEFGFNLMDYPNDKGHWPNCPAILNYVPSLVQIELPAGCNKRKRGD